jgi:aromatase
MAEHTVNSILIDAPLPVVWEMTNDLEHWTELFTEYQSVEILERKGNTIRFRLAMHPDENGVVWSWVSERTPHLDTHEVRAHRVETGPFEFMHIHWRYDTEPGGTRMTWTQDFAMKPTAPLNDKQMAERINANSTVQLDVIRRKVEAAARRQVAAGAGGGDE